MGRLYQLHFPREAHAAVRAATDPKKMYENVKRLYESANPVQRRHAFRFTSEHARAMLELDIKVERMAKRSLPPPDEYIMAGDHTEGFPESYRYKTEVNLRCSDRHAR